jgi:hypothetical protein
VSLESVLREHRPIEKPGALEARARFALSRIFFFAYACIGSAVFFYLFAGMVHAQ